MNFLLLAFLFLASPSLALDEEEIKKRLGEDWRKNLNTDYVQKSIYEGKCGGNCLEYSRANGWEKVLQGENPYVVAYLAKIWSIPPQFYDNLIPQSPQDGPQTSPGNGPPGSSPDQETGGSESGPGGGSSGAGRSPSGGSSPSPGSSSAKTAGKADAVKVDPKFSDKQMTDDKAAGTVAKLKNMQSLMEKTQENDGGMDRAAGAGMGSFKGQAGSSGRELSGGSFSGTSGVTGSMAPPSADQRVGDVRTGESPPQQRGSGPGGTLNSGDSPSSAGAFASGGSRAAPNYTSASSYGGDSASGGSIGNSARLSAPKIKESAQPAKRRKSGLSATEEKELDDFLKVLDEAAESARLDTAKMDKSMAGAAARNKPSSARAKEVMDKSRDIMALAGASMSDDDKSVLVYSAANLELPLSEKREKNLIKAFETAEPPSTRPLDQTLSLWERIMRWLRTSRKRLLTMEMK